MGWGSEGGAVGGGGADKVVGDAVGVEAAVGPDHADPPGGVHVGGGLVERPDAGDVVQLDRREGGGDRPARAAVAGGEGQQLGAVAPVVDVGGDDHDGAVGLHDRVDVVAERVTAQRVGD